MISTSSARSETHPVSRRELYGLLRRSRIAELECRRRVRQLEMAPDTNKVRRVRAFSQTAEVEARSIGDAVLAMIMAAVRSSATSCRTSRGRRPARSIVAIEPTEIDLDVFVESMAQLIFASLKAGEAVL